MKPKNKKLTQIEFSNLVYCVHLSHEWWESFFAGPAKDDGDADPITKAKVTEMNRCFKSAYNAISKLERR